MVKKRQSKRGSVRTHSKTAKKSTKKHKKTIAHKPLKKTKSAHPKHKKHAAHRQRHETFLQKIEREIKEEEHFLMQKHTGKYKIPVGIKVLMAYLGFIGVLYLVSFLSTLSFPTAILFGQVITGTAAIIMGLVIIAFLGLMIYGLWARKAFTFDIAITWFGVGLLNALVSFVVMDSARYSVFGKYIFLSFLTQIVVNTLVIWYLLSEKKYFHTKTFHDRPWHHKDKVFVYTLVSFWVLVLLIAVSYGVNFYGETTTLVDEIILELGQEHPLFAEQTCMAKEGKEKDICLTVLATWYDDAEVDRVGSLCSNVDSEFFRFTCLRSLG